MSAEASRTAFKASEYTSSIAVLVAFAAVFVFFAVSAPGFLSEWLIQARAGRELTLQSSPHVARDYIHLDDVVSGLIAIAESRGPIFNVASGELVTNGAIAEVFEQAGWRVTFTGDASPPAPPNAKVTRLANLGVTARPVRDVVAAYLKGLKA